LIKVKEEGGGRDAKCPYGWGRHNTVDRFKKIILSLKKS
jgi:hypothetical protein